MRILVVGKGFLGEAVGERLDKNHDVEYMSRSSGDYKVDVTESFEIEESFDVVVHAVGLAPGLFSEKQYKELHVKGTENIVDGLEYEKMIYISALGVGRYGHSYFSTKEEAEEIVKQGSDDFTILRPSTIYGKGNKLLDRIRSLAVTRVFPDLKTVMQPILKDDMVDIVEKSVSSFQEETLEVAGPEKMTMGKMARGIYREEGYSCHLIPGSHFMAKNSLRTFGFFPPPFNRENLEILERDMEFDNDAAEILDLTPIFD